MRDLAISETNFEQNSQKYAVVTGGNTGIGLETCYYLMKAGYKIIIGCRSAKAGEEAINYLKSEAKTLGLPREPTVEVIPLDLSSQSSVSEFTKSIKTRALPVSILVNNAGVMFIENRPTKEGFEVHFGVNHLGHFKLTVELLDVLIKNGPSRIINVTSDTYIFGKLQFDEANNEVFRGKHFHRWWMYCNSKLANILFVKQLHKILEKNGFLDKVKVFAVHPGSVSTGIVRGANPIISYLYSTTLVKSIMGLRTPRDGASGNVYVALSKQVENLSGEYFATTYHEKLANSANDQEKTEKLLIQYSEQNTNTSIENVLKSLKK